MTTGLRPLHAIFGPKIETSGGPVRFFGTFKAGLINFSANNQHGTTGFQSSFSDVTLATLRRRSIPAWVWKGSGDRSGCERTPETKSTSTTGRTII